MGPGESGRGVGDRGLLTEATAEWRRTDLPTGDLPRVSATPRSYDDIEGHGQILDDWSEFNERERHTAERLQELGIEVVSVDTMRGRHGPTPDAVIARLRLTVEFKRASSHSAVLGEARIAARQSRRLVLDIRETGFNFADAVTALMVGLGRFGGSFDEILLLGDDLGILWP